ncbi:rhodanese-like domain-containing protein [Paenibacillus sp. y28]|uniref:rhodanese-like domain-containing protein n=1 Tax=Paenibacillus sp. y28 TaxID=3129110 RepID=UPI0030192866
MTDKTIAPAAFAELWKNGQIEADAVIDVRELHEWDYYHLAGTRHVPMNTIPGVWTTLPEEKQLYIICAHGVRSDRVCGWLRQQGVDRAVNVDGGMAAVAAYVDGFEYD